MKLLLGIVGEDQDALCELYLEMASDIICDIRKTTTVEQKYVNTQVKIAIEMYNKRGVEGQTSDSENGKSRSYEKGNISSSLLDEITPIVFTPFSTIGA